MFAFINVYNVHFIGFWNFNPQKDSIKLKQEYWSISNVYIDKILTIRATETQLHLHKFQNFKPQYFSNGMLFSLLDPL